MEIVNMHEAKTHLSKLAQKVLNGERVIISKNNEPLLELVPFKKTQRKSGTLKDHIFISEDCWEKDDDINDLFENSQLFPVKDK